MDEGMHEPVKMMVGDWCDKYEIPRLAFIGKIMQHEDENRKLIRTMFCFARRNMTEFLETEQYEGDLNNFYAQLVVRD